MKTAAYDAIFYLNQATSLEELTSTFRKIIEEYGFDLFAVQHTTPELKKINAQPHYLSNFNPEWVEHYYNSRYFDIDPVICMGKEKRKPYYWSKLWDGIEMSGQQKDFFNEADEYGVSSGVGFPIFQVGGDPGIVSFVSSFSSQTEITKIIDENHLEFALLATNFHHAAAKFFEKKVHPDAPHLTSREKECLVWAAAGKTDREIGMILNTSHRTVNVHMQKAYKKLNCISREQALVKAIYMRIINP